MLLAKGWRICGELGVCYRFSYHKIENPRNLRLGTYPLFSPVRQAFVMSIKRFIYSVLGIHLYMTDNLRGYRGLFCEINFFKYLEKFHPGAAEPQNVLLARAALCHRRLGVVGVGCVPTGAIL